MIVNETPETLEDAHQWALVWNADIVNWNAVAARRPHGLPRRPRDGRVYRPRRRRRGEPQVASAEAIDPLFDPRGHARAAGAIREALIDRLYEVVRLLRATRRRHRAHVCQFVLTYKTVSIR